MLHAGVFDQGRRAAKQSPGQTVGLELTRVEPIRALLFSQWLPVHSVLWVDIESSIAHLAQTMRGNTGKPTRGCCGLRLLVLFHFGLTAGGAVADERELFSCTFSQALARPWIVTDGTWRVRDGVLRQVGPGLDDPSKAVLVIGDAEEMSSGISVTAQAPSRHVDG